MLTDRDRLGSRREDSWRRQLGDWTVGDGLGRSMTARLPDSPTPSPLAGTECNTNANFWRGCPAGWESWVCWSAWPPARPGLVVFTYHRIAEPARTVLRPGHLGDARVVPSPGRRDARRMRVLTLAEAMERSRRAALARARRADHVRRRLSRQLRGRRADPARPRHPGDVLPAHGLPRDAPAPLVGQGRLHHQADPGAPARAPASAGRRRSAAAATDDRPGRDAAIRGDPGDHRRLPR